MVPYFPGLRAGIYFFILGMSIIFLMASLWINRTALLLLIETFSWADFVSGSQLLLLVILAIFFRLR